MLSFYLMIDNLSISNIYNLRVKIIFLVNTYFLIMFLKSIIKPLFLPKINEIMDDFGEYN